jgi:1-acyl-sn-glycerol-3-phosphate acyltransferase
MTHPSAPDPRLIPAPGARDADAAPLFTTTPRPKTLRGVARTLGAVYSVGLTTLGVVSAGLVSLPLSPRGDVGLWIVRKVWAPLTLWLCGVEVVVSGDVERLRDRAPRVIIANHQGFLDAPACFDALPLPLRVLAKKELFKIPLIGQFLRAFGFPSVDRAHRDSAVHSFDQATEMLIDGSSVLVFPEGTRSVDGALNPFKKGAFVMALQAQAEVVPVGLAGSFEAFNRRDNVLHPGPIHVHIGAPISTLGMTVDDRDALRDAAFAAVQSACAEASRRRATHLAAAR